MMFSGQRGHYIIFHLVWTLMAEDVICSAFVSLKEYAISPVRWMVY